MFTVKKINTLNHKYEKKLNELLNGDNTCSIENINKSCFASEACSRGYGFQSSKNILNSYETYVILKEGDVCGCFCTELNYKLDHFPEIISEKNSLFIHTLCIDSELRGKNIGSLVIKKLKERKVPMYLYVLNGKVQYVKKFKEFFDKRTINLTRFYEKTGFVKIDENNKFLLFKI
tara:strand:- start:474 stop:1001 length:528 start_codon:yes stop_codon:yes gene_type:complete